MIYKTYTIQPDFRNPYSSKPEFMFYPTADGISHDADYDGENYKYTGNCKWADSVEEAKDTIDEIIFSERPDHVVVMNGREYKWSWIEDAVKFAAKWNGNLLSVQNI